MLDLIIIGAGLTGWIAAHSAARAGLNVKILSQGLGALHWSAGTVDVLGYYPDASAAVERPLEAAHALPADHPYALLDGQLGSSLQGFAALTRQLGLPYTGTHDGTNLWLPSPVGAARPAFLASEAQAAGDLRRDTPMLIVGFKGLRDFYPELIAENLRKRGQPARAAFLPLDLVMTRRDFNTVHLAQAFDEASCRTRVAAGLTALVQPGERIGLPAILGLQAHAAAMEELSARTGAEIFEIPTLPPSVPGIRLNNALRRCVEKLGVQVAVNMQVNAFHAENDRVEFVETETSARPLKHRARNFLLATGGILGGGINTDHTGKVAEAVFDLPLVSPPAREAWFRTRFFDAAGHPIFRSGVQVNCDFQPVNARGARVYANVWAAGGILAHADPILERSLEGIAIATATAAIDHLTADRRPA